MDLILLEDVRGTGKKGDIVKVNDGYARNFLLPKKLAQEASAGNLNAIRKQKEAQAHKVEQDRQNAIAIRAQVKTITLQVAARCGDGGRLFGAVTNQEIADALKAQHGIELDKRKIAIPEPIKKLGPTTCELKLFADVSATLKLDIVEKPV